MDHDEHLGARAGDRSTAAPGRLPVAASAIVVAAYAWWAVGLPPFSRGATLAVLLAGGMAAAAGARSRRPAAPLPWRRMAPWAGLAVALGAVQLVSYLQQPRADHPTLSSLTNAALDTQTARALAFVVWLAATVALARR